MQPIVTPAEMADIDASALLKEPIEAIIDRVGQALARQAIDMLGGVYGRRVVAIAGPGLNGADTRSCVEHLRRRGVHAQTIRHDEIQEQLPPADLVIDGAFGTGLSRPWAAANTEAQVMAVDIPSGIDGLTGSALGQPMTAKRTVTLAALKPGLLLGVGPTYAGDVRVADIGLNVGPGRRFLVDDEDVATWIPDRERDAHKWRHALLVVAGSPGMTGAATLSCLAAMRAGCGYVHLDTAASPVPGLPVEVVSSLGGKGVATDPTRFAAAVVGPGLGRSAAAGQLVTAVMRTVDKPLVLDGDGLTVLGAHPDLSHNRVAPTILTPHDGEFERLMGHRPGDDRFEAAEEAANSYQAVVLLKGPCTIIAQPDGPSFATNIGDERLATAGSGDVLAGIIGAFLASGMDAAEAAAAGAVVHGLACLASERRGLIATDLANRLPRVLSNLP